MGKHHEAEEAAQVSRERLLRNGTRARHRGRCPATQWQIVDEDAVDTTIDSAAEGPTCRQPDPSLRSAAGISVVGHMATPSLAAWPAK